MNKVIGNADTDNSPYMLLCTWLISMAMICSAALFWSVRYWVLPAGSAGEDFIIGARILSFALAVAWLPYILELRFRSVASVTPFATALALLFLPIILFHIFPADIARLSADYIFAIVSVVGIAIGIWFTNRKPGVLIWSTFGGVALGVSQFTVTLGKGYITPFAFENTIIGIQHRDTVFHAAIANMLEFHGQASIGLDGLTPINYHVLYHQMSGTIARWLNVPALKASYLLVSIVLLPLMFLMFLRAIFAIKPNGWTHLSSTAGILLFLCWPFMFSLFQGSSYFSSETYILSLLIFFAALPLWVAWSSQQSCTRLKVGVLFLMVLSILVAGLAKISTGAVLAAGTSAFFVVSGRFSQKSILLALGFGIMPFTSLYVLSSIGSGGGESIISPLNYLFEWTEQSLFYILLTFATAMFLWKYSDLTQHQSTMEFSLMLMALAALASSLLLELPAGAASYFANPGMWICILILATTLPTPTWAKRIKPINQNAIAVLFLIGLAAAEKDRWVGFDRLKDLASLSQSKGATEKLHMRIIQHSDAFRDTHGSNFLIAIGSDFDGFWDRKQTCWAQSFVVPALTSQPMINGLPPSSSNCELTKYYGLAAYDGGASASRSVTDQELCTKARKLGFSAILKFENLLGEEIVCP